MTEEEEKNRRVAAWRQVRHRGIRVGGVVATWHLTEDPVLVTNMIYLPTLTTSSAVEHRGGVRIIGQAMRANGELHAFWFTAADVTQVLA